MATILDTVLLIALPASGKSEVRRYLDGLDEDVRRAQLHMGPTVQLDDFPYVHLMRRIDQALEELGKTRVFFTSEDGPFRNALDWGTLIELLNEDHRRVVEQDPLPRQGAGATLLDRIDAAREAVGGGRPLAALAGDVRRDVAAAIEGETAAFFAELAALCGQNLAGKTLVIEFARGGPDGASMPLPAPLGYAYSIGRLSPAILERLAILYIWVTPEESRRKNVARTDPDDPGSILHHGVPHEVMIGDYGCDDIDHLLSQSGRPDTIRIAAHGRTYELPLARFDNRIDRTSFIRKDPSDWGEAEVRSLHEGLADACRRLAERRATS